MKAVLIALALSLGSPAFASVSVYDCSYTVKLVPDDGTEPGVIARGLLRMAGADATPPNDPLKPAITYFETAAGLDLMVTIFHTSGNYNASVLRNGAGCWAAERKSLAQLTEPEAFACGFKDSPNDTATLRASLSCKPLGE